MYIWTPPISRGEIGQGLWLETEKVSSLSMDTNNLLMATSVWSIKKCLGMILEMPCFGLPLPAATGTRDIWYTVVCGTEVSILLYIRYIYWGLYRYMIGRQGDTSLHHHGRPGSASPKDGQDLEGGLGVHGQCTDTRPVSEQVVSSPVVTAKVATLTPAWVWFSVPRDQQKELMVWHQQ